MPKSIYELPHPAFAERAFYVVQGKVNGLITAGNIEQARETLAEGFSVVFKSCHDAKTPVPEDVTQIFNIQGARLKQLIKNMEEQCHASPS